MSYCTKTHYECFCTITHYELFYKNFTALLVVSDVDNIMFYLAEMGYLGLYLKLKTEEVKSVADQWSTEEKDQDIGEEGTDKEIKVKKNDEHVTEVRKFKINTVINKGLEMKNLVGIFITLCKVMITGLSYCIIGQWSGTYMSRKYPDCEVMYPRWIGDGKCHDNAPYFTKECVDGRVETVNWRCLMSIPTAL